MPELEPIHTLVATLGGQPQVVTFTLDLLLQRGIPIREVIVIHPATLPHAQTSIARLSAEFIGDRYRIGEHTITIHFRRHMLRYYEQLIDDIVDERTADGALNTMDQIIRSLKQQQRTIHFSITGGRRLMSLLSFSAALLNFESTDRIWHIYTPDTVRQRVNDGAMMHVSSEEKVCLIEVPFARLAQPILSRLLNTNPTNVKATINLEIERTRAEEYKRCKAVIDAATPRQREVLRAFAKGLNQQEVARQFQITISTVDAHKTKLLEICRTTWGINERDGSRLGYHFLYKTFAAYFNNNEYTSINEKTH